MRVLAIETSGSTASVALVLPNGRSVQRSTAEPQRHAERLLMLVEQCLAEASCSSAEIDRVAVGVGPGSFTGLRVGVALAQGIALGLGRPLIGVPSLLAMAHAGMSQAPGFNVVSVVDAHRGEVFAAAHAPDGSPLWGPLAVSASAAPEAIATRMADRRFVLAGVAARDCALGEPVVTDTNAQATWVGRLGERGTPGGDVVPLYARGPDAVLPTLPPNPLQH
jgi:tRNA threonylcarbamoyl adenosine modification protein YeaZ